LIQPRRILVHYGLYWPSQAHTPWASQASGYQIVWATLAQRHDVDVRRLFTDQGDPLPRRCDLFGLSLSWELDGPVLPELLRNQRIPIWATERNDDDPIVFGGGPVLTANPEPLAPFFDAVLLGDGELLLPAFIDALQAVPPQSTQRTLAAPSPSARGVCAFPLCTPLRHGRDLDGCGTD
jgi:UDP:flavonoid glycosyltransferase YjiC (YdhE family)